MKRRLLIFSSLITLLLSCFSFPICAEESIEDIEELAQVDLPDYALDQYFYDNYILLPYIESNGSQYINTYINASDHLKINFIFSDFVFNSYGQFLFGSMTNVSPLQNALAFLMYRYSDYDRMFYRFQSNTYTYDSLFYDYSLYNILFDENKVYLNGSLLNTFNLRSFEGIPIYIFGRNENGSANQLSSYKLYKFSIYDYSLNNGQGGFVRFYYPAKSKSGGVIGLYDSISKTFFTTSGSVPFSSPIDDQVMSFQISDFLDASLNWIEAIFLAVVEMPIIIVFMAIGLAGVMFRWGRRIVHF